MRRRSRLSILLVVLTLVTAAWAAKPYLSRSALAPVLTPALQRLRSQKTVGDRLRQYGPVARARWVPFFHRAEVGYPPQAVVLLGLKQEQRLEVYAGPTGGAVHFIRAYPILAASGDLGPKRERGDGQVPEGIYRVESLHPNSEFHLALRTSYPNTFDRDMARRDGRADLGSDIMIHGAAASIGCLAMGDPAAEDLFVLAADTGPQNVRILLAPVDFRKPYRRDLLPTRPAWVAELYASLRREMRRLPVGPEDTGAP